MRSPGEAGFTLLEAMVAITIVSLMAVASLAAVGTELRMASRARLYVEAAALAQERLAILETLEVLELESLPDSLESGRFSTPFDDYRWKASSEHVTGERNLFQIAVTVESPGVSYRLVTRVFRPVVARTP